LSGCQFLGDSSSAVVWGPPRRPREGKGVRGGAITQEPLVPPDGCVRGRGGTRRIRGDRRTWWAEPGAQAAWSKVRAES